MEQIAPPFLIALACLLTGGLARGETAPNTLSDAERRGGWRLLFDGRDASAFRGYRRESLGDGWQVRDGALARAADGAGDIVSRDQFGAFEVQLEYRIPPAGNSGLMFHVTEDSPQPWHTGPEVQILDNASAKETQKAGWLYGLYQPKLPDWVRQADKDAGRASPETIDATRPAGEWNHLYLRVSPGGCEVSVNGVVYERFKIGSKDWDERVAKSKFASFPGFGKAGRGHLCLQDHGAAVAFRSIKVRELPADGARIPFADEVAAVQAVPAFPDATWEGWSPESDDGKPVVPLRPLVVTHAGDGSGRRFVLDQSGMIHVFRPGSNDGKLFLDLRPGTSPWGKYNEEGLLGLAFHPRFRETGEFFITYSVKGDKRIEHLCRYRVSQADPDRADPASEELVLAIDQPYWNHNGGSIAFGPDGYLYWGLGDGGSRDDPLGNGQKLDTLLGKILRIDVDRREGDRAYAIPADNPFVGRADARGEIFAFGFRNPWQIAFDRDTGRLWAADVGQDLLEEVDIVTKGGNYGWSLREGTQPFGNRPEAGAVPIDPVWEYDHQVGKSITGGFVYRGWQVPALVGAYLYGDFVSGRLWALHLDAATGRATNREIPWSGLPIFGFGTDADGEAYVLTSSPTGQGVFRLAASDTPPRTAVPEAEVAAAFSDGVRLLFEGRPAESARAFDRVVAARPAFEPELWQRGIALYYAGRFADGRRQFEIHRGANPADVENVAWHFACVAREQGAEAARAALLPVGADARVPMREILALFEGRGTPEAVLAAADAGPEPALRNQRCYAHLYLGLHAEACGRDDDAKRHLRLAAGPYAMDHFMGRVAQLHVRLRGWGDTTDSR